MKGQVWGCKRRKGALCAVSKTWSQLWASCRERPADKGRLGIGRFKRCVAPAASKGPASWWCQRGHAELASARRQQSGWRVTPTTSARCSPAAAAAPAALPPVRPPAAAPCAAGGAALAVARVRRACVRPAGGGAAPRATASRGVRRPRRRRCGCSEAGSDLQSRSAVQRRRGRGQRVSQPSQG